MNLIKSTSTYSFFTFLSRILGYLRDFLIALNLGSGPISDAFFVAFRVPNTFRRLFSEGSFNSAFVPSYASELAISKNRANSFAKHVLSILIIALMSVILLIEIFMPFFIYVIAPGFIENNDKLDLTIFLTRISLPFLFFVSIASFFAAILNSYNKFGIAAASPIILNIILILILYFIKNDQSILVKYLSFGISLAGLLQLLVLYFVVRKYFTFKFSLNFKLNSKVKFFFKKLLPSIFSSGVTQINILVGTIIASFQANAVSYLYYADRIYQINLAIAGIAIGTVLLPSLSKYIKQKNISKIQTIQNKSVELSLFLSLPATLALILASEEITSALFGYGAFDLKSVKYSANALYYFAYGLPAFALIKIFSSFLFARHNTNVPFYISLISVFINILISIIFFNQVGFLIIPIATTLSSWFNAIILYFYLVRFDYYVFSSKNIFPFLKIICSSSLSTYVFHLLILNFSEKLNYDSEYKLLIIFVIVFITFIVYLVFSFLIKTFKINDINLKY